MKAYKKYELEIGEKLQESLIAFFKSAFSLNLSPLFGRTRQEWGKMIPIVLLQAFSFITTYQGFNFYVNDITRDIPFLSMVPFLAPLILACSIQGMIVLSSFSYASDSRKSIAILLIIATIVSIYFSYVGISTQNNPPYNKYLQIYQNKVESVSHEIVASLNSYNRTELGKIDMITPDQAAKAAVEKITELRSDTNAINALKDALDDIKTAYCDGYLGDNKIDDLSEVNSETIASKLKELLDGEGDWAKAIALFDRINSAIQQYNELEHDNGEEFAPINKIIYVKSRLKNFQEALVPTGISIIENKVNGNTTDSNDESFTKTTAMYEEIVNQFYQQTIEYSAKVKQFEVPVLDENYMPTTDENGAIILQNQQEIDGWIKELESASYEFLHRNDPLFVQVIRLVSPDFFSLIGSLLLAILVDGLTLLLALTNTRDAKRLLLSKSSRDLKDEQTRLFEDAFYCMNADQLHDIYGGPKEDIIASFNNLVVNTHKQISEFLALFDAFPELLDIGFASRVQVSAIDRKPEYKQLCMLLIEEGFLVNLSSKELESLFGRKTPTGEEPHYYLRVRASQYLRQSSNGIALAWGVLRANINAQDEHITEQTQNEEVEIHA